VLLLSKGGFQDSWMEGSSWEYPKVWRCGIVPGRVLKKKSWDFSRLREVPEASTKSERMVLSLLASWAVGVFISRYHPRIDYEKLQVGGCEGVGP
jgi:hypothetical protein